MAPVPSNVTKCYKERNCLRVPGFGALKSALDWDHNLVQGIVSYSLVSPPPSKANMDVSTAAVTSYATCMPNAFKQTSADFELLAQAVPCGDFAVARQAFAALQQDSPWVSRAMSNSGAGSRAVGATVASAWRTLSKALQWGDAVGAQQAFAALQQALRSGRRGHLQ